MARYRRRARRAYRGARRGARKVGGMLDLSMETVAGIGIGYSSLDEKIPHDMVLIAATAPVKGFNKVKKVSRGIIFGNRLKQMIGGSGFRTGGFKGI